MGNGEAIQISLAVIQLVSLIFIMIKISKNNYKDVMDVYYNARKAADSTKRAHQRIDSLEQALHRTQVDVARMNGRSKRGNS